MMKLFILRLILWLLPLFALALVRVDAQSPQPAPSSDELFRTIESLDAALFNAFNRCDVEKFTSLLADDLEHRLTYVKAFTLTTRSCVLPRLDQLGLMGALMLSRLQKLNYQFGYPIL